LRSFFHDRRCGVGCCTRANELGCESLMRNRATPGVGVAQELAEVAAGSPRESAALGNGALHARAPGRGPRIDRDDRELGPSRAGADGLGRARLTGRDGFDPARGAKQHRDSSVARRDELAAEVQGRSLRPFDPIPQRARQAAVRTVQAGGSGMDISSATRRAAAQIDLEPARGRNDAHKPGVAARVIGNPTRHASPSAVASRGSRVSRVHLRSLLTKIERTFRATSPPLHGARLRWLWRH
jgi:hypothetical protein